MKFAIVFLAIVAIVFADIYMHNPRGSNDRLNENNVNRNNANRLYDSQNNAKGGYCYGPAMTFYERSLLMVEWTVQHGCGANPKLYCNFVIQYMCGRTSDDDMTRIRDGSTTNTIPDDPNGPLQKETNGDYTFGMHESYQYYQDCKTRTRNMGLYIADRQAVGGLTPGRRSAIFTRQNNNGNRHGYECNEERDYYPYWHPSPWKDIAILTHNTDYCDFYKAESQNVKPKGYCADDDGEVQRPNNPVECQQQQYNWMEAPAHGIAAPDCLQAPWSRDNHLGNGVQTGGYNNNYNWTLPSSRDEPCINDGTCECVLRARYNISTIEEGYPDMSRPDAGFADWTLNGGASITTQNPVLNEGEVGNELQLAIDTSQFGRTFEDRSHVFHIAKRPDGVSSLARIFNLNVRGKRGNIVQAYPAVEYDFVPSDLHARVGDYVHFQWTGCDTNPAGYAGQGRAGTDRSNCVQIVDSSHSYPAPQYWIDQNQGKVLFEDAGLRLRMAQLDQTNCLTKAEIEANGDNADQSLRYCGRLNAASPYFNGGLIKMNKTGSFHFMSTRNHNFTNRDQKGSIIVSPLLPSWALGLVIAGSVLFVAAAGVAGMMFYAKNNPHSGIANVFSKM
jgi:hypothetical protein